MYMVSYSTIDYCNMLYRRLKFVLKNFIYSVKADHKNRNEKIKYNSKAILQAKIKSREKQLTLVYVFIENYWSNFNTFFQDLAGMEN